MFKHKIFDKLAGIEASSFPFLSIYLNTEKNDNGKPTFPVVFKTRASEEGDRLEEGSLEKESFDADVEKINDFLEDIDPSTRGAAIFASTISNFFATVAFEVPFEEGLFFVFDKPHIFPLVRLLSQHPKFAVLLADTNAAGIYVFHRGKTIEKEEIQNTKTNRSEVGGWSQMRFQRHNENFHQQHAREAVDELEKIVRAEKIEHIILAGDETVIMPLLKAEISKEFEDKIAGTLNLNVHTPEHEVLDAAEQAIKEHDTLRDKEKIDNLMEQNYDDGIGVVGVEKTLTALLNGQVQELYISADFDDVKYNSKDLASILGDYAPGEDGDLPSVRQRGMVIDELLKRAVETADDIRFIEDRELLKDSGGVGALLRYQAKGVTNL